MTIRIPRRLGVALVVLVAIMLLLISAAFAVRLIPEIASGGIAVSVIDASDRVTSVEHYTWRETPLRFLAWAGLISSAIGLFVALGLFALWRAGRIWDAVAGTAGDAAA